MRIPLLVAVMTTIALFALAPAARADGFYVTFKAPNVASPRVRGAVFSSASPGNSAHVEIDDWAGASALFSDAVRASRLTVVVEFTGSNDQVYLTSTFSNAALSRWNGTFAPASTPRLSQAVDFDYERYMNVTSTGAQSGAAMPRITRMSASTPASLAFDDVYMQVPSIDGDRWVQLTGFSITIPVSGGKPQPSSVAVTKAMGVDSSAFQAAVNSRRVERTIKLVFRKRAASGTETPVLNVELDNALFNSDVIQSASSGQSEAITITYQKISFQEVQQQQQSGTLPVSTTYDLQAQKAI